MIFPTHNLAVRSRRNVCQYLRAFGGGDVSVKVEMGSNSWDYESQWRMAIRIFWSRSSQF